MDKNVNATQRNERIFALLSELGIIKCKHTKIKALSGGEKRRVSLAVEVYIYISFNGQIILLVIEKQYNNELSY